ncbi:pyridoxamine 5'-phosphate oxidase family protein [Sinomonas sp. ASV322]|uniref:pyridoxamine 5'-phosphate oxidase family protein n=1 Tax=Sinomonas sp. ASV322 TaxID=3041920 RepID=UPI0027DB2357|nr:pyridoxamine 5'-phosphate oxidase family protein [Sinomonas sp. ASV322]MDQ4501758.1 pyridoxamine 5'-phosphate oxidase family protein [Sinomonas sp. ASV322]
MSTVDYGYGPGARHQDVELDEEKCWALLGSSGIGRFASLHEGCISVFPVHYVVLRGGVYFRTSRAGAIASAVPQEKIALQIDSASRDVQAGWSVLVSGDARPVEDEALATELFGLSASEPWAGGVRDFYVGIVPSGLTGRQVFLG